MISDPRKLRIGPSDLVFSAWDNHDYEPGLHDDDLLGQHDDDCCRGLGCGAPVGPVRWEWLDGGDCGMFFICRDIWA